MPNRTSPQHIPPQVTSMISDRARQLLSQDHDPYQTDSVLVFSDYNGDSVVLRVFRYQADPTPEAAAAQWLRTARQQCDSPSGQLQTFMLAFPALGGWTENNVIAVVSGYDIIARDEHQDTD